MAPGALRPARLAPEQLLRRAAAICLARTCTAASYPQLGELLGIPPGSAKSTVKAVHGRLEAAGRQAEFEAAIDALAGMLDTAVGRTDYGSRRHALRNWVISPGQWNQLTVGLPAHREAHADWGEGKRMLASAWVWTHVTGGEHLFAPAVMADPAAPRSQQPGGRDRRNYIDLRWPHLATGTAATTANSGNILTTTPTSSPQVSTATTVSFFHRRRAQNPHKQIRKIRPRRSFARLAAAGQMRCSMARYRAQSQWFMAAAGDEPVEETGGRRRGWPGLRGRPRRLVFAGDAGFPGGFQLAQRTGPGWRERCVVVFHRQRIGSAPSSRPQGQVCAGAHADIGADTGTNAAAHRRLSIN